MLANMAMLTLNLLKAKLAMILVNLGSMLLLKMVLRLHALLSANRKLEKASWTP
ncbi:hypothetical protein UGMREWDR_CDS0057 [Aeromonas phage GomatiRiver_11]|nr:hypothetical protein UGMREWDR_CDS0057 [Aeromonas phage GomatiRiver_11]